MKFIGIFLSLMLSSIYLSAQEPLVVSGKITDKTGKPIEFVTVSILHQSIGTLTNEYGEFRFFIPKKFESDTISFSCIGYEKLMKPISEYTTKLQTHQISLTHQSYSLEEIKVLAKKKKKIRATDIIERAINNIAQNYPNKPFMLHGYFRDYLKDKDKYMNLLEAAVRIEDMGFNEKDYENSQIEILQTSFSPDYYFDQSKNIDFDNKDKYIPGAFITPFGGNELSTLRVHDPIRNSNRFSFSFIGIMEKDFLENHNFRIDSITVYNNQYVYCISFSRKPKLVEDFRLHDAYRNIPKDEFAAYRIEGMIYISGDDYAIHKINYTNFFKNEQIDDYFYNCTVEYKKYQEKMYLNYLSFSNYFEMVDKNDSTNFKLEKADFYLENQELILEFNHVLNPNCLHGKGKFKISYNGKNIKVNPIRIEYEKNLILKIVTKDFSIEPEEWFTINEIIGLEDISGNKIDDVKILSMYQFREFFVNKIETESFNSIPYNNAMPKKIPLYQLGKKDDPNFWDTYNFVRSEALLK